SQDTELSSSAKEDSLRTEFLAEEIPSGDEYECISPDDISLMESPSDQFEMFCISSTDSGPEVRAVSPLTCSLQGISEATTASCTINAKPVYSVMSEVCKTHLQHLELHKSMAETQEQLHDLNNSTKTQDRLHALLDAFSGFVFQSDATRSCPRQMVTREEIKSSSEKNSVASLTGQAPNFSQLLSNKTVMEGSPVTLECHISGHPQPTVTWYREDYKIESSMDFQITFKAGLARLVIREAFAEDSGRFTCTATNKAGSVSTSCQLYVKGMCIYHCRKIINFVNYILLVIMAHEGALPAVAVDQKEKQKPEIVLVPEPARVLEGETARFRCRVTGYPLPKVNWYLNGQLIRKSKRFRLRYDGIYYLDIVDCKSYDTGEVRVTAENPEGFIEHKVKLEIQQREDFRSVLRRAPEPKHEPVVTEPGKLLFEVQKVDKPNPSQVNLNVRFPQKMWRGNGIMVTLNSLPIINM
uniref:Ig-like domain-containing protein n=1 Tax=Athene cunicularia TaxID=194338 RepID=A0A663MAN0_ATHCN